MKKYRTVRVSDEFYNFIKQRVSENKTSFRIESRFMLKDYAQLKTLEKKIGNKKVFVIK